MKFPVFFVLSLLASSWVATEAHAQSRAPDEHDWPCYNQDANGHRHSVAESVLGVDTVSRLVEKWRFPPPDYEFPVGVIHATPSVVNGYVYFGTATYPAFYKLTPDGQVKWRYQIGDPPPKNESSTMPVGLTPPDGVYSSALVTADSVYFGDARGVAYCLDRATGEERWKIDTHADTFPCAHPANLIMASPIAAADKIIFAGGAFEHSAPLMDPSYKCCKGRGFVFAADPQTGKLLWKYNVGPKPVEFDPPLEIETPWGKRTFHYGPSTSSVWCTPSYDPQSNQLFFGTDVHNSPRKPTPDDPRNYTPHSAAVISLDAHTGKEKWVSQLNPGDVWNHTMPTWDAKTKIYKDQSVGDTPKIFSIEHLGARVPVVGAGCKNGGFYVMRLADGQVLQHTPIYRGPPVENPTVDPRTLALPGSIGGIQTGCATDGKSVFVNGIDRLMCGTNQDMTDFRMPPATAGRVTSISLDTTREYWRHERPKVAAVGGTKEKPLFKNVGDPCASGIAVANGVIYFTTLTSNQLVALNSSTGEVLNQIHLGPVFAGPSVSRGRIYIGTGNTQFIPHEIEAYFPKRNTGVLHSFGLPKRDPIDAMGAGDE